MGKVLLKVLAACDAASFSPDDLSLGLALLTNYSFSW